MSAGIWVAVGLLSGFGAVARFLMDGSIGRRLSTSFPAGTLAVNLLGSFALGVLVGSNTDQDLVRVAALGLLGSFTTFSTWMFETQRLAEDGEAGLGVLNVAVSLAMGVALAWAGLELGGLL